MHHNHDHIGHHTHDGQTHTHSYAHTHDHDHEGHPHDHGHQHSYTHTHEGGNVQHDHDHQHEHDHAHDHQHSHDHGHSHCEGSCQGCASAGTCQHTPMEELTALMKYMVGHNASHARELAALAQQLKDAGQDAAYEQVLLAVSDFEKGNLRLSAILQSLA